MYCVIKCIVRGNQVRVKNADLRHPSCTVVMNRRKSVSPVHNVLIYMCCTMSKNDVFSQHCLLPTVMISESCVAEG